MPTIFILTWLRGEVLAASTSLDTVQLFAERREGASAATHWTEHRGHGFLMTWDKYAIQEITLS